MSLKRLHREKSKDTKQEENSVKNEFFTRQICACGLKFAGYEKGMVIKMIERIKTVLSEFTEVPKENMTEESDLVADLGLDSLDVVNLAVAFEEEFNLEIPDRHIKELTSIRAIKEYLEKMEA